jgi:hypothetical protein
MAVQTNLKSMSIDKLMALKDQIQSTLASKVAEERRTLEAQLGKLSSRPRPQMRAVWSADAVTIQPCRRKFDLRLDTSQRENIHLFAQDGHHSRPVRRASTYRREQLRGWA